MFLGKKTLDRIPFGYLITPAFLFMVSTMIVNGGNYGYNVVLGRVLSPSQFSEAGLMITFLLIASFVAMTFQLVVTKFMVDLEGSDRSHFLVWFRRFGIKIGVLLAIAMIICAPSISQFFQLSSRWSIIVFSLTLPLFFAMSIERGRLQGAEKFTQLSVSYQSEMWGRVVTTFALLTLFEASIDLMISIAIFCSVLFGHLSMGASLKIAVKKIVAQRKKVYIFMAMTAGYEGAQILINYADILLVKHYFEASTSGLYTSVALIGRMIYFMTWMMVMVLIPRVLRLKKEGGDYEKALINYFVIIVAFSSVLIAGSFLFSEEIVFVLFGDSYLPVASQLWQYGLATMLFALANLLVYYFLAMDNYIPVFIAMFVATFQVICFTFFHDSLAQMILIQIINMSALLTTMIAYFMLKRDSPKK